MSDENGFYEVNVLRVHSYGDRCETSVKRCVGDEFLTEPGEFAEVISDVAIRVLGHREWLRAFAVRLIANFAELTESEGRSGFVESFVEALKKRNDET